MAPEYADTGLLNERCDTYSFGIVLLETITGRDPIDYASPLGEVCCIKCFGFTCESFSKVNVMIHLVLVEEL